MECFDYENYPIQGIDGSKNTQGGELICLVCTRWN